MYKETNRRLKPLTLGILILAASLVVVGCSSAVAPQNTDPETLNEPAVEAADLDMDSEAVVEEANIETDNEPSASESTTFKLEAWADNWFAAYLEDGLIIEDSVPITTERSFNAETTTFEASYPLYLNFILKDFKENDTGLEYIGERNQQMGDGGFIMQLTDLATDQIVAVTDETWACTVIHEAPLDKSCENEADPTAGAGPCGFSSQEEPAGWLEAGFDDSAWSSASTYSVNEVSPKDGYDQINWDANAELIWGPDLETSNTVLCRITVSE